MVPVSYPNDSIGLNMSDKEIIWRILFGIGYGGCEVAIRGDQENTRLVNEEKMWSSEGLFDGLNSDGAWDAEIRKQCGRKEEEQEGGAHKDRETKRRL